VRGWSSYSSSNSVGVTAEVEPSQMVVPTRGTSTTETQMHIEWTALTTKAEVGGELCTILSYNLQWD
jgi:hypothetical protein